MMTLDKRELATVLASLRHFQNEYCNAETGSAMLQSFAVEEFPDHFAGGIAPLDGKEIDALCERLNVDDVPMESPEQLIFELTDQNDDTSAPPLKTTAHFGGGQLCLSFEGYGEKTAAPGTGKPVLVEVLDGELRVVVWSNVNQEDPTHTISLAGARESLYKEEDDRPK